MATMKQILHGENEPPIIVGGFPLMRPAPDDDGKYRFDSRTGVVTVEREDVAAATEFVMGAANMGLLDQRVAMGIHPPFMTLNQAKAMQKEAMSLRRFVHENDPDTYYKLLD